MEQAKIPMIWKNSIIIPLPKPGNPAGKSGSYRLVSLLCLAIKILERLGLRTLQEHLPMPAFKHGFRANHSTTSALSNLSLDISQGFNQENPLTQKGPCLSMLRGWGFRLRRGYVGIKSWWLNVIFLEILRTLNIKNLHYLVTRLPCEGDVSL